MHRIFYIHPSLLAICMYTDIVLFELTVTGPTGADLPPSPGPVVHLIRLGDGGLLRSTRGDRLLVILYTVTQLSTHESFIFGQPAAWDSDKIKFFKIINLWHLPEEENTCQSTDSLKALLKEGEGQLL